MGRKNGAGRGNRTLVACLEGKHSTIELYPRRAYWKTGGAPSPRYKWKAGARPLSYTRVHRPYALYALPMLKCFYVSGT